METVPICYRQGRLFESGAVLSDSCGRREGYLCSHTCSKFTGRQGEGGGVAFDKYNTEGTGIMQKIGKYTEANNDRCCVGKSGR